MKYDVSNKISETVADYSVSYRQIAWAAGVSPSTISRASKAGYMVTKPVRDAIQAGCNKLSACLPTATLAANLEKQVDELRDTVAFSMSDFLNGGKNTNATMIITDGGLVGFASVEIPVNKVDGLHPSCTTLVDDQLESAHSREKAELQKALAARISEVENLAADVAYEREKNATQAESIGQCLTEPCAPKT